MTAVTSKFETVLILMSVSHTCDYTHFNSIHKKSAALTHDNHRVFHKNNVML